MIEYIELSIKNLFRQKSRTFLTVLGLIIGIGVIVAMVSITEGMKVTVKGNLDKMGNDRIYIFPSGLMRSAAGPPEEYVPFKDKEITEIERIPGVKLVAPYFMRNAVVEFKNKREQATIGGSNEKMREVYKNFFTIETGREIEDTESGVVVIGHLVAIEMFGEDVNIGDSLKINGEKFQVVGIYAEIGGRDDDMSIFIPIKAAQKLFDSNEISFIGVVADSEKIVNEVSKKIEDRLKKLRGSKDFEVMTTEQAAEQVGQVLGIIEFVLAGIASVSLLVGGVIIMNTMLMSVLERTREIGVMKATGATSGRILALYLAESAIVGLTGGMLGILAGAVFSKAIEAVGKIYIGGLFVTSVSPPLITGALLFSVILGSISGIYPAWRAAKMDPIVALRYE